MTPDFPWDQLAAQVGPLGLLVLWIGHSLIRRLDRMQLAIDTLPCRRNLPCPSDPNVQETQETGLSNGARPAHPIPRAKGAAIKAAAVGLVLAAGLSCSAPQRAEESIAAAHLMQCLVNCGANAAGISIREAGKGRQLDGEALSWDLLGCAAPCLARFGIVTLETYTRPPARWYGTAGAENVYRGDGLRITITPK